MDLCRRPTYHSEVVVINAIINLRPSNQAGRAIYLAEMCRDICTINVEHSTQSAGTAPTIDSPSTLTLNVVTVQHSTVDLILGSILSLNIASYIFALFKKCITIRS